MHISRPTCALAILAAVGITACDSDDGGGTPPVEPASIVVVADRADDALRDRLLEIATDYLERIAGIAPGVVRLSPPSSSATVERIIAEAGAGLALVLDAERLAGDRVPAREIADLPEGGYRLVTDQVGGHANSLVRGDHGATVVYLAGESRLARQYALYEALRRLGVRYYHPEEEYVPRVPADQLRARAATPTALARPGSDDYLPDFRFRGFTFHGPHPLEQLEAFSDGDFPIDEAVHVTEWSIKNRGETFRGPGRGVASAEARAKRSQELEDLRHFYGMTVGTGITLHNVQQGGRPQIDPSSPIPVQEQIETLVEERFATTPDATQFGIHFGPTEVSVTPDIETVQWINWAGARALELRPDIPVIINNHTSGGQAVDNFSDLGCPPGTNDRGVVDYYDLAYHTDPRLGISVHTVMLPPLEGAAFVYNQVTFAHKLCLMQRASAEGRPLEWFPESSWWLSYDNPIPVYLPLYMKTRRRDIELVTPLLENRGGTVRRHKQFNSGHEWGYWQQDYAVGMWHWNVDVSLDDVLGELADPMCDPAAWPDSCAARDELVAVLDEVMQQQQADFLDDTDQAGRPGGLFTYFTGEDPAEELSVRAGFTFHPQPVTFPEVASWDEQEAQRFRDGDLADLTRMASAYAAWTDRLNAIEASVPEAGLPWLREVRDGVEINGLRAAHVAKLFEAILAFAAAERRDDEDPAASATPLLESAAAIMADAEQVIRRREQAYRYPAEQVYGGGLTAETAVPNGTTYEYRVHTKTHLLTYWHIRQDRAQDVVDGEMLDPTQIRARLRRSGHLADHRLARLPYPRRRGLTGRRHRDRSIGHRAHLRRPVRLPDHRFDRDRRHPAAGRRLRRPHRAARSITGLEPEPDPPERPGCHRVHPRHLAGVLLRRRPRRPGDRHRRHRQRTLPLLGRRSRGIRSRRGPVPQLIGRPRHATRRHRRRRRLAALHRPRRRHLQRPARRKRLRRNHDRRGQHLGQRRRRPPGRAGRLRRTRRLRLPGDSLRSHRRRAPRKPALPSHPTNPKPAMKRPSRHHP